MTPEGIARAAAAVIEALRAESENHRKGNRFVEHMLIDPSIIAACVAAYLASERDS